MEIMLEYGSLGRWSFYRRRSDTAERGNYGRVSEKSTDSNHVTANGDQEKCVLKLQRSSTTTFVRCVRVR